MDSESLRTASTYLNNLLLARGLLRNGADIDFVKPSRESRAQIINLVHDLVLRSDRDKDRNEHLSFSLRGLRAEDTRKDAEIERLKTKSEEHARDAVQARTAERVAKDEAKKVERNVKGLQDQVARLKTALSQVRTQCANDVKKRDLELARLKAHLQDQRRGNRTGVVAPSMTVSGGERWQRESSSSKDLKDPEYSLKQETTAFLTQLSQSLSDENDGLIGLLREALSTMKELLGLPANTQTMTDSAIGSRGSADDGKGIDNNVHALPASYETLATELDNTLSHLSKILTNPNFVSVDEVEMRDDEIVRLRQGWEHMETRWRDVLAMMDGWRRRMDTGETLRLEDLQQGMGLVSPTREDQARYGVREDDDEEDQSFVEGDVSDIRLEGMEDESSMMIEPPQLTSSLGSLSASKRKRDILEPPASFDLRPPGTVQRSPLKSARSQRKQKQSADGETSSAGHVSSEQSPGAQMTLNEKLDAVAKEAADAQAAREAQDGVAVHDGAGDLDELQDDDTLGQIFSPVRKTQIRGRAKRRKSTLSREELAELLVAADEE
jgi:hypothetical protein